MFTLKYILISSATFVACFETLFLVQLYALQDLMLVLLKPLTKLYKAGAYCKRRFTVLFGTICEVSLNNISLI